MDNELNARLLYEWNTASAHLDFTITQAEHQLINVNKRLHRLRQDLVIYAGMLILPLLLIFCLLYLLGRFLPTPASYILYVLVAGFAAVLTCAYIIAFPILLFHLIKTLALCFLNRENPAQTKNLLPPEAGSKHNEMEKEATYRIEQQKLIHVLNRYYLYPDTMEQLRQKIDAGSISLEEFEQELKRFTYYKSVCPADGFTGPMVGKAQNIVFIAMLVIIAGIVYKVIFFWAKIIGSFRL